MNQNTGPGAERPQIIIPEHVAVTAARRAESASDSVPDPEPVDLALLAIRARRGVLRFVMRRAFITTIVAIAALAVSYHYGGLLGTGKFQQLHEMLAIGGAVVFLAAAVIAVRGATNDVIGLLPARRLGDARASTLRLLCLLAGYILVILGALSLLHVPVEHLLLGGVLTGVLLGIAAQQVLANVFAGIMLLFTRPFTLGDELTIRSGALGGPVIGTIAGMTLTYVTVLTEAGPVLLPNSAVLASAVGPASPWSTQ
ncbi:MAG TPA: mechanosensitive ion channel family protein [Actinocrinis sp.]|jgi:small-conductance mechanosensitive channel